MTYAGAVTTRALVFLVIPGVLLAGFVTTWLAQNRSTFFALVIGGGVALAWSEAANVLSGESNGPAARSTFLAASCALLASIAAGSRYPALFLGPVPVIVFGALALGAGGEVGLPAVATTVAGVATLGWIERENRRWATTPGYRLALVLLSIGAGAAASAAILVQVKEDHRQPVVLARAQADPSIVPAWSDPLRVRLTRDAGPRTRLAGSSAVTSSGAQKNRRSGPWFLIVIATLLSFVVLATGFRVIAVRLAWARARRRLAAGPADARISGAWVWARLRLERCQFALSPSVSPDVLLNQGVPPTIPAEAHASLRTLAVSATAVAFSRASPASDPDAAAAWRTVDGIDAVAVQTLSRRARLALALRRPPTLNTGRASATIIPSK